MKNRIVFTLVIILFAGHCVMADLPAETVNVIPADWQELIAASTANSTISFAPGTYTINGSASLQSNRTYVGNGAVLKGDGTDHNNVSFANTAGVDFSGFVLDGVQAVGDGASALKFHANTVENLTGGDGIREAGMTNSQVNGNTFTGISGHNGIYGYPGNGNQFDNNRFDQCWEGIHLIAACDSTDVSGNVVTNATNIGIELQDGMTHLTVENNWIDDWTKAANQPMDISCATGGATTAPFGGQGQNIAITGNYCGQNGAGTAGSAGIEIMGGLDINVTSNYLNGCGVLNGTMSNALIGNNNIFILKAGQNAYGTDATAWPITPNTLGAPAPGDKIYAVGAANLPAIPSPPANVGNPSNVIAVPGFPATPATAPTGQLAPTASPQAVPTGLLPAESSVVLSSGPNPGQVTVSFPSTNSATPLSLYASTQAPSTAMPLGNIPAGATQAVIGGIPQTWFVTAVLGSVTSNSFQVATGPIPASGPFAPTLVSANAPGIPSPAQPVAPITVKVLTTVTSADGGKTFSVTATTQP